MLLLNRVFASASLLWSTAAQGAAYFIGICPVYKADGRGGFDLEIGGSLGIFASSLGIFMLRRSGRQHACLNGHWSHGCRNACVNGQRLHGGL